MTDETTSEDAEVQLPLEFKAKHDDSLVFEAVVVGLTEIGMGFRSADPRLGSLTVDLLTRHPFMCNGVADPEIEIYCSIQRIEPCRHDPNFLYFGVAEFLKEINIQEISEKTGLKVFASKRQKRPVISKPPPPLPRKK